MNLKLRFHSEISRHKMKRLYAQFIRAGDLAFDLGANAGSRTRVFSELGARVIAVEPQKECVQHLYIQFHDDPRVTIIPKAVGAGTGHAIMQVGEDSRASSLNPAFTRSLTQNPKFRNLKWNETRNVPVTTLDALIGEFGIPAFVKIDVEGYEAEVFKGLTHSLSACSFEFHTSFLESARQSIARLEQLGAARYNYSIMETMQLSLSEWVDAGEMLRRLNSFDHTTEFLSGDVYARMNAIG